MTTPKLALITGANRGIGLETAKQLAEAGLRVLMTGRNEEDIRQQAEALQAKGLDVHPLVLDITRDEDIDAVATTIEEEYGKLDVLVNNAGMITGETFAENSSPHIKRKALRQTMLVNYESQVAVTQAMLPLLKSAESARVVNVSSILGSLTLNSKKDSPISSAKPLAYNASKAALNMFTIILADSLAETNIKVNAAHPGWVKTDMGGEQAPVEIEDGAKTCVALALLDDDGPTGGFFHNGDTLPW